MFWNLHLLQHLLTIKKFQMYNAALGLFFEKANTWDHRILELKHTSSSHPNHAVSHSIEEETETKRI